MSSFIAAGTAYATHGMPMIPFFIYYSMFGFQRIGDLIWAAADMRARGFLLGGTAGRTTLNGEGLAAPGRPQPLAGLAPCRTCVAYDPAFAYEIGASSSRTASAACTRRARDVFYYLTLYNENYPMPPMPEGRDGRHPQAACTSFEPSADHVARRRKVHLLGSGAILREALRPRRSWPRSTASPPTSGA